MTAFTSAFDTRPLRYLADVRPSGVDKHIVEGEQPVRLCNYTDIYYNERITADMGFMNATATGAEIERFTLRPGDVVLTKDSETADDIGIAALVADDLEGVLLGYHNALVRPHPDVVEPRYLRWAISSLPAAAHFETKARGVTRVGLRAEDLAALPVPLPPLDVQRRVADMLDAETARIDTLIAKNRRVLELLDVRRVSILEDGIFGIEAQRVGIHYLATYINGYPFKPEDKGPTGLPIIRIAQLLDSDADVDYYQEVPTSYCHIDTGDLLFSWSGSLAARIWDRGPAYLNQHLFRVVPDPTVDKQWLLHALNAAVPRMHALTHGSTMTHITRPMMTRIRVPKPGLERQRVIAAHIEEQLDRMRVLAERVHHQIGLLRLRRQAIITAAVTGQIDV